MTDIKPFLCDVIDKSLLRHEWEKWLRSFHLYLAAEEITDNVKKKNKLLHLGGPQLQEVIYNLPGALIEFDKEKQNDVFHILVEKLSEYFSPKRNSTFERHLFRALAPLEGENFSKFLIRLRQQVTKCSFGETKAEIEQICIKDKIIDSWAPTELRKKLLEKEMNLSEVVETCQVHEQIDKQSHSFIADTNLQPVNKVIQQPRFPTSLDSECGRCGRKSHSSNSPNCPARNARCNKCQLMGHFAAKCKTKIFKRKMEGQDERKFKKPRFSNSNVKCVEEVPHQKTERSDCFKIKTCSEYDDSINCTIGGNSVTMIIDSGSKFKLLSECDWDHLINNNAVIWNIRSDSSIQFRAYAADNVLKVLRVFDAPISVGKDPEMIATFYVITHKGLFRYKRLMFGINSAPEIFQRIIEEMLSSCRNTLNYIDDIIIFGKTAEDHDKSLNQVLEVFRQYDVTLNEKKCVWRTTKLKFLGHILSNEGFFADPEKVKVIQDFRQPNTKEETRSFLGLVTYVGKFIPDLATNTDPLRILLKQGTKFVWGLDQEKAFQILKAKLSDIASLAYFDPKLKTRLVADASPVALGAVLLQFDSLSQPKVISYASKALSDVEKRYSQTEKESLALVWSVEKFHYYLAGLEFELVTDHKPLEAIFKPSSKPPARIERWMLRLQGYKYKVIYRSGKENIADPVSRLCKLSQTDPWDLMSEENLFRIVSNATPSALTISLISSKSATDKNIVAAINHMKNGSWENETANCYYPFRFELTVVGSILLRHSRIVIPESLRQKVLELAHEGHPGESAMKRRLRLKVWWPQCDKETERFVKGCLDCLLVSQPTNAAPMNRHAFPEGPWQCIASDLMGPLPNKDFILVLIDYYSRYTEVVFLKRISSEIIIKAMMKIFSKLGFPKSIRTDNGRQYVSSEFNDFCKIHNIKQIKTPPYWPQANGEVENMNRSLGKRLKIAHANNSNYEEEILKFILMYNVTPHGTTGAPPSQLMFNRIIRDKIPGIQDITEDMIDSSARDMDLINKQKGKKRADEKRRAKDNDIEVGDKVLLKNVIFPHKLTPNFDPTEYEVVERHGNEVLVEANGKKFNRNVAHLKKIPKEKIVQNESENTMFQTLPLSSSSIPASGPTTPPEPEAPISPVHPIPEHHQSSRQPDKAEHHSPEEPLKLKLKNVGGMWQR